MPERADTPDKRRGCRPFFLGFLAGIVFLVLSVVVWLYYPIVERLHACTLLPGGARIEFPSFEYVPRLPRQTPKMRLRDGTGNVLIETDGAVQFHPDPSDASKIILKFGADFDHDLYIDRHGLSPIIQKRNAGRKEWYELLPADPTHVVTTSLYRIHIALSSSEKHYRRWCKTFLFSH